MARCPYRVLSTFSLFLFLSLSFYLSISIYLSIYLSVYLPIYFYSFLSVFFSFTSFFPSSFHPFLPPFLAFSLLSFVSNSFFSHPLSSPLAFLPPFFLIYTLLSITPSLPRFHHPFPITSSFHLSPLPSLTHTRFLNLPSRPVTPHSSFSTPFYFV